MVNLNLTEIYIDSSGSEPSIENISIEKSYKAGIKDLGRKISFSGLSKFAAITVLGLSSSTLDIPSRQVIGIQLDNSTALDYHQILRRRKISFAEARTRTIEFLQKMEKERELLALDDAKLNILLE